MLTVRAVSHRPPTLANRSSCVTQGRLRHSVKPPRLSLPNLGKSARIGTYQDFSPFYLTASFRVATVFSGPTSTRRVGRMLTSRKQASQHEHTPAMPGNWRQTSRERYLATATDPREAWRV